MIKPALLLTAVLAFPASSGAQSGAWDVASLPGSPRFIADVVGWKTPQPDRVRLAREIARLLHASRSHGVVELERLRSVLNQFEQLNDVWRKAAPTGALRINPDDRSSRRAAEEVLDVLGLDLKIDRGKITIREPQAELAVERRSLFTRAGVRITNFAEDLTKNGEAVLVNPSFEIPLPLGRDAWVKLAGHGATPLNIGYRILVNRELALVYIGALSLDRATLDFVNANPTILKRLVTVDHAPIFAAFGRSLHIEGARIALPGGQSAADIWSDLVGESADDPSSFIDALLTGDDGRLAWFFDFVSQSPPSIRAFTLSLSDRDPRRRRRKSRRVYAAFQDAGEGWSLKDRPFDRPDADPVMALIIWRVDAKGGSMGPTSRRFWSTAVNLDDVDGELKMPVVAAGADDEFGAADLVEISLSGQRNTSRLEAMALGQLLSIRDPAATADELATVIWGSMRLPALVRVLDRMPLKRAATVSKAVRAGAAITGGDPAQLYLSLTQFQSAMAILDRASSVDRFENHLDDLVASLSSVPLSRRNAYDGALVRWFREKLVPVAAERAITRDADDVTTPAEYAIRAWLAGLTQSRPTAELEWEGWKYHADPARPRFKELSTIRDRQRQVSVDRLIEFSDAVDLLASVRDTASARAATAKIRALAKSFTAVPAESVPGLRFDPLERSIESAARRLDAIRNDDELRRSADVLADLLLVVDRIGATALRALAYAPFIGDAASPLLLSGDVGPRHDYGFADDLPNRRTAWSLPMIVAGRSTAWHLRGSVLALDFAMASLLLRDSVDGLPPEAGAFHPVDRLALIRSAVTFPISFDWTQDNLGRIATAIQRGRASLPDSPFTYDGRWEWRYQAMDWVKAREPGAESALYGITDFLAFGVSEDEWTALASLGTEQLPMNGSLRLALPPRVIWETILGHFGPGLMAAWTPDLRVRVAELLAELKLPGLLAASITGRAAAKVFAGIAPADPYDWSVVQRRVMELSRDDVSDLVAALTSDGTLITIER
jgi:hypothetical protein